MSAHSARLSPSRIRVGSARSGNKLRRRFLAASCAMFGLLTACSSDDPLAPKSKVNELSLMVSPADAHYRYLDKDIEMDVDPRSVLVEATEIDPRQALGLIASAVGIPGIGASRLSSHGSHWRLSLPMATTKEASSALRARILSDSRFSFVSPRWITREGNHPVEVTRTIAVRFRAGVAASAIDSIAREFGLTLRRRPVPDSGYSDYLFRIGKGTGERTLDVANALGLSTLVQYANAEKFSDYALNYVPTDPYYNSQYYLANAFAYPGTGVPVDIAVQTVWDYTRGGLAPSSGGLTIAVLDDGSQASHPDFAGHVSAGADMLEGCGACATDTPADPSHGQQVVGMIVGQHNNGIGIAGIAPDAFVRPIRIFDQYHAAGSDVQIANGISMAWSTFGAHVISNSWSGGAFSFAIYFAINDATTQGRNGLGTVVVFSAGNGSQRGSGSYAPPLWPSTHPQAIAVSAIDRYGVSPYYAPRGLSLPGKSGHPIAPARAWGTEVSDGKQASTEGLQR